MQLGSTPHCLPLLPGPWLLRRVPGAAVPAGTRALPTAREAGALQTFRQRVSSRGVGCTGVQQDGGVNGEVESPSDADLRGEPLWPNVPRPPLQTGWPGACTAVPSLPHGLSRDVCLPGTQQVLPPSCRWSQVCPWAVRVGPAGQGSQVSGLLATSVQGRTQEGKCDSVPLQGCRHPCQGATPLPECSLRCHLRYSTM